MEQLVLISKADLKEVFQEWAREIQNPDGDELMTSAGMAEYTQHSIHWVLYNSSRAKRGHVVDFPPIHRSGRKLLFRKSEVDKWLEGRQL